MEDQHTHTHTHTLPLAPINRLPGPQFPINPRARAPVLVLGKFNVNKQIRPCYVLLKGFLNT